MFKVLGIVLIAVVMYFIGKGFRSPERPAPVLDAEKACIICESLNGGGNPETAKIFAMGTLATCVAFDISVTVKEDANAKIEDLKSANELTEKNHQEFEEDKLRQIASIKKAIEESEEFSRLEVATNSEDIERYNNALKVFFG